MASEAAGGPPSLPQAFPHLLRGGERLACGSYEKSPGLALPRHSGRINETFDQIEHLVLS